MSKVGKFAIVAGGVLAVSIIALAGLIVTSGSQDSFLFLRDQRPLATGVFPIFQDGAKSRGFTDEYRIYSWKASYASVRSQAEIELTALGFVRIDDRPAGDSGYWHRSDGASVYMEPMHSESRKEAMDGKGISDPEWVTVISSNPIPDTWISHIRYALEPNDY